MFEIYFFKKLDKLLQIVGSQFCVGLNALFFFDLVDYFFKFALRRTHNDVGEHLYKSAIAVVCKSRIARLCCKSLDGYVVETQVEYRVHHTRHRRSCARTNGYQKRIFLVSELLACVSLYLSQCVKNFFNYAVGYLLAVLIIFRACFCGYRKTLRHRHTPRSHLCKVGALSAE